MQDYILILIVSVVAAIASYYINIIIKKGAVFGSAIVVLISGIIFPHLIPEIGTKLAVAAATGSYAGMCSTDKFPKLLEMIPVGLITGAIFNGVPLSYDGVGGRLGTIAAISCLTWMGIKKALNISFDFDSKGKSFEQ